MNLAVARRGQTPLWRKRNLRADTFRRQQGRTPLERFVDARIRALPVKRLPVQQKRIPPLVFRKSLQALFYTLLVLCITTRHAPCFIYRHLVCGPTVTASIPTPAHQLTHSGNNSKGWTKRKQSRLARIRRTNTYRQHGRREFF